MTVKYHDYRIALVIASATLLIGCDSHRREAQAEMKTILIYCVAGPKPIGPCSKLFKSKALVKTARGDAVRVADIPISTVDFHTASKDSMIKVWKRSCRNGCEGFNDFEDWWASF